MLLKEILEGREDEEEVSSKMLEFERGNVESNSLENSLLKRLWICRKTDYTMNEWKNEWTDTDGCETRLPTLREHTFQISENTLFDHNKNEEVLEELKAETVDEKLIGYKPNWLRHVKRMNNNRMPKILLNYRPNGRRQLRRPSKRLSDEAETGLSRPDSWRMTMMMKTVKENVLT